MAQFTQREYLFLDDLMHFAEMNATCAVDMASHSSDAQIQQLCMEVARRNERHFSAMFNHMSQAQGSRQTGAGGASSFQTQTMQNPGYTYGQ